MGGKPRRRTTSGTQFAAIHARAAARKGGEAALEALLPLPHTRRALRATPDHRCLAEMTRAVFRAGFVWKIVDAKWPDFEAAFHRFDLGRAASLDELDLDRLAGDPRVIRNRAKLASVRDNARYIIDVCERHGSFGAYLADWPDDDTVGLWHELKTRGSRLGGFSGPLFLRSIGKDTFMFSADVVRGLIQLGVVSKAPTSQRDLAAVQATFNQWRAETGRPLCQLSRILACSID